MPRPAKRQRVTRASAAAAAAAAAKEEYPEPEPRASTAHHVPEPSPAQATPQTKKSNSKKRPATADEAPNEPVMEAPPKEQQAPAQMSAESPSTTTATNAASQQSNGAPSQQAAPKIDAAQLAKDRLARFKSLQARAKESLEENLKEATKEVQRLNSDTSQLPALERKHAIASQKLLKSDVEAAGGDFERERAWDWTVDECDEWDKRVKKKAAHRDGNAFRDYQQESNKVYKRQLRNIKPDLEQYDKQKMAAVEKAAASGGLDIVETENGELIAIDKDGSFYSTADSTNFAQNKPDKAAVDRLVQDLRRAEDQRLKKRRDRMADQGDQGDVTYINEKNKQFNQKLARFYDKYTADIRDSFERGTMI